MRKYRIVIVEDDEDEQIFMKEGFEKNNLFEVMGLALNGESLIRWFLQKRMLLPDLILSDINMPGMNGYELLETLKENPVYVHIPVVITSTAMSRKTVEHCLSAGASAFIVKPDTFLEYPQFASRLYQMLENRQLLS